MSKDKRMILDDPFFAEAWKAHVTIPEIAQIYGTSRAAIYRAAKRFKLGPRCPTVAVLQRSNPCPVGYQNQLIWSNGKWSLLQTIACNYSKTLTQVQKDFHRARMDAK
jgi:hypothetical protein